MQSGLSFLEATSDSKQWGQFFESAIGAYILSEAFVLRLEVYYWREGNDEVDFILKKNQKFVTIEVKSNGESTTLEMALFQLKQKDDYRMVIHTPSSRSLAALMAFTRR